MKTPLEFVLEQHEEPASGSDHRDARPLQLQGGLDERLKPLVAAQLSYDRPRRSILNDSVHDGKGPCAGVPDIARDAGKASIQHEDAEREAVDIFPARRHEIVVSA